MSLLTDRRPFLPACLTLGALLCALPTLAYDPVVPAAVPTTQTIVLQHTVLSDILKALHWDQHPVLPAGVTQISFRPDTNSLLVVATPVGFAKVQDLVRVLDVEPRQVQIKFALANATAAGLKASGLAFEVAPLPGLLDVPMPDTKYAAGGGALFLQTLTKQGAVTQSPVITTSNNVSGSLTVTTLGPQGSSATFVAAPGPQGSSATFTATPGPQGSSATFAATPRVNSDDSVTLALHLTLLDGTVKREIKTLRTVRSGDTMVFVMAPNAHTVGGKSLLLFVTPTIIATDKGPSAMTVK